MCILHICRHCLLRVRRGEACGRQQSHIRCISVLYPGHSFDANVADWNLAWAMFVLPVILYCMPFFKDSGAGIELPVVMLHGGVLDWLRHGKCQVCLE